MADSFSKSLTGHFRLRSQNSGGPGVMVVQKSWVARSFNVLIVIVLLIFLIFSIGYQYFQIYPKFIHVINQRFGISNIICSARSAKGCNVFNGSWVLDETYPLYNSLECPFTERAFNCLANGRKDKDHQKWRWKPQHCDLPRFNVQGVLESLRGKRVVFVGDSMSRTQWESLICILMTGVEDKKSVYEINGNKITKQIRFLGTRFSSFNFTIEFFRSVFLVVQGAPPKNSPKKVRSTLELDVLDDINASWIDSDILIFNTGQWWTPVKLFNTGCYFQVNGSLNLGMPIPTAFRIALKTWASWVETNVNTNRTHVFFRTFEPSHYGSLDEKICNVAQMPMSSTNGSEQSVFSDIISDVVAKMKVPVNILHVTYMAAFRNDAHVGKWSDTPSPDCSHWCLPGVPDVWNQLLFSYLLPRSKSCPT
ncbi:protein trichome berefringence-like 7 [Magnolia sinica]|uniref:protein trichome berefringence-like 7 n=1 Tax=Magnolia sinica TaxID=86752 RepID=UPI00265AE801|nr:protein trichome berefringence-like 7 [Magnolia sinica]